MTLLPDNYGYGGKDLWLHPDGTFKPYPSSGVSGKLTATPTIEADGGSGDIELERELIKTMTECFTLWKERHKKYGRGNIEMWGALGCLVRGSDKLARLREHYRGTGPTVCPDETVEDSWRDIVNYGLMGLMCHLGRWKKDNT